MTPEAAATQSWNTNPRMIERWFPCAEVSVASKGGWGSGNSEANLFTWFAKRPLAQARAAVITSLLPWPDDTDEQRRLQDLVRLCLTDYDAGHDELVAELQRAHPDGPSMLDPFSGRAMIPLEAARYHVKAWGIDYSPVATLAGQLLADYPLRDWDDEPPLPFTGDPEESGQLVEDDSKPRLLRDVEAVLDEVGRRWAESMQPYYPKVDGKQPWGYLWAVTLPCQECSSRFPLVGSLVLRHPLPKKDDPGQSFRITVDKATGTFDAVVHSGAPEERPTMYAAKGKRGKSAVCPFCDHVHPVAVHTRLMTEGHGRDAILVAADIDEQVGKSFRAVTDDELAAIEAAKTVLQGEEDFGPGVPAVPDEKIPAGNNDTVRASKYGAATYGELCNARQTLSFVRLAKALHGVNESLQEAGTSHDYRVALSGYACAVLARKLRRSTRGATLQARRPGNSNRVYMSDVFMNEAALAYNYDYFETGIDEGPGTWGSVGSDTLATLRNQLGRAPGRPANIRRGSATALMLRPDSLDAVVTDPPYDAMIDYSDASDLFYVWLKRALADIDPSFSITTHELGVQEKDEEIIVKRGGKAVNDHRDDEHYDTKIAEAFAEANRVVKPSGVVTIVFGHGDPDVWKRLLSSIDQAGLVLTGSWPAQTEKGGGAGSANIITTLTLSCRPAPQDRPEGRVAEVDAEVRREIANRIPIWDAAGLALTDQLMAAAGPAMEVVGRYSRILDKRGEAVDISRYLPLARQAVEEAADIRIDSLPLGTFDVRTRFALFWVRLFGRLEAPASEARWQRLASDLEDHETDRILTSTSKGVRLAKASEVEHDIDGESSMFDVALAMAAVRKEGLADVAEVINAAGREGDDEYLWACVRELAGRLPEADEDGESLAWLVRNRQVIADATRDLEAARRADAEAAAKKPTMFDVDDDRLFPQEGTLFSQGGTE